MTVDPHSLGARTVAAVACLCFISAGGNAAADPIRRSAKATAATAQQAPPSNPLELASGTIASLVSRVSASVVQIAVSGYRPTTLADGSPAVARGRSIGSGVIVDASGYILTNAHVVAGAEHIDVVLADSSGSESMLAGSARSAAANLVGVAPELDLALLSIPLKNLRPLPIAEPSSVRQGELVFAFGSPDGLRNSVSMGMVSSAGRQADPGSAMPYVQTDAAINPGNSGGPLVDINGRLVGINTFIRSASGGSEGLGFAIPSTVVSIALPQLREFGHVHRAITGVSVQPVTPALKAGLRLPVDSGLIVSDILDGSPADDAGIDVGDVITAIDNKPVANLTMADFYLSLLAYKDGQDVSFTVRRGDAEMPMRMKAAGVPHLCERNVALFDSRANLIERLSVLAIQFEPDPDTHATPHHPASGIVVTARVDGRAAPDVVLTQGDVIHSVNGIEVRTMMELRRALADVAADAPIVLQVERNGQLTFVALDVE